MFSPFIREVPVGVKPFEKKIFQSIQEHGGIRILRSGWTLISHSLLSITHLEFEEVERPVKD